jgi:hypothetical protein
VVHERPRPELRDGQKPRTRDELVFSLVPTPARHIGRERQSREVVAGQEAFGCEVAIGVEVPLVDSLSLGEKTDLTLRLRAQPLGVVTLGVRPGMVDDDLVMQLALPDC